MVFRKRGAIYRVMRAFGVELFKRAYDCSEDEDNMDDTISVNDMVTEE